MNYKQYFLYFGILVTVAATLAFTKSERKAFNDMGEEYAPSTYFYKAYSLDTLANAANDTLTLSEKLLSNYEGVFQVVRTNISGTTNVALKVEQAVITSGNTDWVSVATGAGTGATTEALQLTSMLGTRYRIILDGTGTQSTSYRVHVMLKKKN